MVDRSHMIGASFSGQFSQLFPPTRRHVEHGTSGGVLGGGAAVAAASESTSIQIDRQAPSWALAFQKLMYCMMKRQELLEIKRR